LNEGGREGRREEARRFLHAVLSNERTAGGREGAKEEGGEGGREGRTYQKLNELILMDGVV